MKQYDAEEVLARITEHTGQSFDQNAASYLSKNVPEWMTVDLAKLSVDELAKAPTLDGSPPDITPYKIVEMARSIRQYNPADDVPDDSKSYPSSPAGKFAAAYTDVVERVMLNTPEMDFKRPGNYFWALSVASGVLKGTNNIRGEVYEPAPQNT